MKFFSIRSIKNNEVLFEGRFYSFKTCVEQAVAEKMDLSYANLSNLDLSNANLDDARLAYANFSRANLTGANLSESNLAHANFDGAALYNVCFALSNLQMCNFENASFGATDITGANISCTKFSTLSCFTLGFIDAREMHGCVFKNPDGTTSKMSRPPIVINGLKTTPLIFMDRHIKAGQDIFAYRRWLSWLKKQPQIQNSWSKKQSVF